MEKGYFQLADPSHAFELEPGKKTITGGDTFQLELSERVIKARQQGILLAVRPELTTTTEEKAVTRTVRKPEA